MTRIAVTTEAVRLKAKADKLAVAKARADERQRINDKKIEDRKAERAPKLAAVDVIGKQITSLADKIKRESDTEAAAKQKGDSFFKQLTDKLAEVEPLAKAAKMTMKELKLKYVGDRLGDTRFKLAIRIARGLITHEQATAADTEAKREQRAAAKPSEERTVNVVQEPEPGIVRKAELGNDDARQTLVGLGWKQSEVDGKPAFTPPSMEPTPQSEPPRQLTPEEISDDHLTAFKTACNEHYVVDEISAADRNKARVYFNQLTDKLTKLVQKAA